MTRVYRDSVAGKTWVDRGSGTQVLVLPDHGDPHWQWSAPAEPPVWDDELHQGQTERIGAAVDAAVRATVIEANRARDRLIEAVAKADLPAATKATIRKIIGEVLGT